MVVYASAGHLAYEAPTAYTTYASPAYHAPLAYQAPAYGHTSQNVIRTFGGTVSQYAKAVDTPFSSVRKQDTRITNNLYSPGLVQYTAAAPAHHYLTPAHTTTYAHPATTYTHAAAAYAPAAYAHPAVSHVSFDGLGAHYAW